MATEHFPTEEETDETQQVLRICMPSVGDMDILEQKGGTIDLRPIFYGPESMGPHIQVLEGHEDDKGDFVVDAVAARYKLKLKKDGRVELKKAQ